MRSFSELELDALTEAFNLSLGEAAATFSAIVREEIDLSFAAGNEALVRTCLRRRLEGALGHKRMPWPPKPRGWGR